MKFWRRREESLEDEVRDYIDRETQLNIDTGMPPEEARYAAHRKLGTTALVKENTRAAWGWTWMERLWQDLRYGCRTMLKNPGFTLVALISLAIGVGANSAMFSLADGLILRPLPVYHPGEVVTLGYSSEVGHFGGIHASYRDYVDFRDKSKSFDGLVAYTISSFGFSAVAGGQSRMKSGMLVSGNFFRVLGVEPELGRTFRAEEDQAPGRDAVVILGHDFWEKELSADPAILGRRVLLSGIEFTVIGVAPTRFTGMDQYFHPAFYVPTAMWPRFVSNPKDRPLEQRDRRWLTVKGRLKPGVTVAQAQSEMTVIGKALERTYPDTNRNRNLVVRTEFQTRVDQSPPDAVIAGMLLLLAGVVLAVACANVAGLLLSRAPVRAREISLRLAIGAGRGRLIRQLLTESFLIAIAGGLLGIGAGYASTGFFSHLVPPNDQQSAISVQLDQRALWFSLAVSLVSAILCGLAPAIQTTRTDLITSLRTTGADTPHRTRLLGRNALVAAQVALSMMLLMISTFVYRAFRMDLAAGPGFRTDHLLMMTLDPSLVRYNDAQTQQFYRQVSERARSTAGVRSATLVSGVPMDGNNLESFTILPEGYQFPKGQENVSVFGNTVDENFFDAVNIGILRGRGFRASDSASAPRVAVVNEVLAKHYWPNKDPIGKRMRLDRRDGPWVEIVGVAKSTKYLWIAEGPTDFLYVPFAQRPRQQMTLLALSAGDPAGLAEPLRQVVRTLDTNLPVFGVQTFEEFYHFRAVSQPNLIIQTVGAMGVMGLLLAMVGLYGLVAYAATRRRREIGIRMAIGAGRGTVLRMVLGQGLVLALGGIGVGLAASVGVERLLNAMLENDGTDIVTYLLVAPALLAITALAVYIPARRASRIDPMRVLRYE
jgi:putative ABC transport system permease protein